MSSDSQLVAGIDKEGTVAHVWSASTGTPLAELRNEALGMSSLAFSSEGRWLATTGGNDVRVFDTRTWALATTIPGPRIDALSRDPSGPRLLTGSAEGDAFSPDGRLAAAASRDGAEQLWDATSRDRARMAPDPGDTV